MTELLLIAVTLGSLCGLLVMIFIALWQTRKKQEREEDDDDMLARIMLAEMSELNEPGESLADTAIRVSRQRKDAQRRARQRKAKR